MCSVSNAKIFTIVGLSGSGKSTVGAQLAERLNATLFQQDTTLIESAKRSPGFVAKFDLVEAAEIVDKLCAGVSVSYLGYSQVTRRRDQLITLEPRPVIIVEGVLPLRIPGLRERAAVKLWVDAPLAVREARQLARWEHDGWLPGLTRAEAIKRIEDKRSEEEPFILPQRDWCDLIIDNSQACVPVVRYHPGNGHREVATAPQVSFFGSRWG